jgi:hypothetical protein
LQTNPVKPDIIIFADPNMNEFISYNPDISNAAIIDFYNLKTRAILQSNQPLQWFISEQIDPDLKKTVKYLCKKIDPLNPISSLLHFSAQNNIDYTASNHTFLAFDEFIRNPYFNDTSPLIGLLHHSFETALAKKAANASAYLMTLQDYIKYNYTLQALHFPGFKRFTCQTS